MDLKDTYTRGLLFAALASLFIGCQVSSNVPEIETAEAPQGGIVTECIPAGKNTFVCIDSGQQSYWLATGRTNLEIGDEIVFVRAQVMRDFYSSVLERQFPVILFVDKVNVVQSSPSRHERPSHLPSGHPLIASREDELMVPSPIDGIPRASDGYTVAELHEQRKKLAGSRVRVAGKVVKVNRNIMGLNWIHLKDGSDFEGDDDLTVTTAELPHVGAVVTVEGLLLAGKTFQKGFHVSLLIDKANLTGEPVSAH